MGIRIDGKTKIAGVGVVALIIGVLIYALRLTAPEICQSSLTTKVFCGNGPAITHSFAFSIFFGMTYKTLIAILGACIVVFCLVASFEAAQYFDVLPFYKGTFDWRDSAASLLGCLFAFAALKHAIPDES